MRDYFERPTVIKESMAAQKGLHPVLEILVFIALFFVSTIAVGIIQMPALIIGMIFNQSYLDALSIGDVEAEITLYNEMTTSAPFTIVSLFATIGMIGVVFLFCRFLQKRKLRTLGFVKKDMCKEYLIGMVSGFLVFSVAVLICVLTGSLEFHGFSAEFSIGFFLLFVLGYMIQGMSEEVFCRGYFMVSFSRRAPVIAAIMANALLFAALHLMNPGITVLAFVNLALFGIFASIYFLKRGNIWGVAAFHSIWNLVQGNVYGIEVSGMASNCSILESTAIEGRELINGGSFGLEGGLAVTIVLLAGIIFLCTRKPVDKASDTGKAVRNP